MNQTQMKKPTKQKETYTEMMLRTKLHRPTPKKKQCHPSVMRG